MARGISFLAQPSEYKTLLKMGEKHEVRDGACTFFCLDWWQGEGPQER
jgi:hypothetical protein